jgi:hypothetical protein
MPANHVLFEWATRASMARQHRLGKWHQQGDIATATCEKCGRNAFVDFTPQAAAREQEVSGDAVADECDSIRAAP